MLSYLSSRARAGIAAFAAISVVSVAAACSSGSGPAGHATKAGYKLVNPGYLTVAYTDGDLPEIAAGPKNTLLGTDGVLLEYIAKQLGLRLKPVAPSGPA